MGMPVHDDLTEIEFNGQRLRASPAQTVLGALWGEKAPVLHVTARRKEPRTAYCGIGLCFDCIATVDGTPNVRTCMTMVEPGMVVQTQADPGDFDSGH